MASDQPDQTPVQPEVQPDAPGAPIAPDTFVAPTPEPAPPTPAATSAMPGRPWTIIIAVIVVVVLVAGTLVYGWSQGWFGTTPTTSSTSSSATPTTSTTTSSTATAGSAQQLNADFNSADQSLTSVATDSNNAGDSLNDKQGDLSE